MGHERIAPLLKEHLGGDDYSGYRVAAGQSAADARQCDTVSGR